MPFSDHLHACIPHQYPPYLCCSSNVDKCPVEVVSKTRPPNIFTLLAKKPFWPYDTTHPTTEFCSNPIIPTIHFRFYQARQISFFLYKYDYKVCVQVWTSLYIAMNLAMNEQFGLLNTYILMNMYDIQ